MWVHRVQIRDKNGDWHDLIDPAPSRCGRQDAMRTQMAGRPRTSRVLLGIRLTSLTRNTTPGVGHPDAGSDR